MTPTVTLAANGGTSMELAAGTNGIQLTPDRTIDSMLPVVVWDETYAESLDSQSGSPRYRRQPKNALAGLSVRITGDTDAEFIANYDSFQEFVQDIDDNGGTLAYQINADHDTVTFTILSCHITAATQNAIRMGQREGAMEIEYTVAPFGLKGDPIAILTNISSNDIVLTAAIADTLIGGSAPALGRLIFTEQAAQPRKFWDWGLEENYVPATPAVRKVQKTGMSAGIGTSQTRSGSYGANVWRGTLSTSSQIVALFTGTHIGRQRLRLRCYPNGSGVIRVRARYGIGESDFRIASNGWQTVATGGWRDADLGVVTIPEALDGTQGWECDIEAYSTNGGDTVDVDTMQIMPASRYGKAASSTVVQLAASKTAEVRHDRTSKQPAAGTVWGRPTYYGAYLELPPRKALEIVARARRVNIDDGAANDNISDQLRIDLIAQQRVAVL